MDSGAIHHITPYKSDFKDFSPCQGSVHLGDKTTVADDFLLHQARKNELKGIKQACQVLTKPDMETSHTPTLQDNSRVPQAVIPLFKVRERNVTLGKCG
jgi:hypothetical protein